MNRFFHLSTLATIACLSASVAVAQPANDMFASRILLSGTNVVTTGSNIGATAELGEPYHAGVPPMNSIWWSWTAPTSGGTVTISTAGSSFDTVLGVYVGTLVSALTEVASNDDDPDASVLTSKVDFDTAPSQTYQIAVDGFYGSTGSVVLQLNWTPPPPPRPAPGWRLPDPLGNYISSTDFAGKVVILNFWATWCGPCVAEIPDLDSLQKQYRADGLVIVGADVFEDPQIVLEFINSPPLSYTFVMSDSATVAAYGGIPYIPSTFIISRDNLIMKSYVGTQSRSTFERQIIPLLYGNTRLYAQPSGSQLVLRWPTNAVSFILEWAKPERNPSWTTWPVLPSVINHSNTITLPISSTNRLFRLRLPY